MSERAQVNGGELADHAPAAMILTCVHCKRLLALATPLEIPASLAKALPMLLSAVGADDLEADQGAPAGELLFLGMTGEQLSQMLSLRCAYGRCAPS